MGWRTGRPATLTDVTVASSDEIKKTKEITAPHQVSPSPEVQRRRTAPTLDEQHVEAVRMALEAEQAASARRDEIKQQIMGELRRHKATLPARLDFLVDARCGEDDTWRAYVSTNQWQLQRATMFGTAITARNTAMIYNLLKSEARERRRDDHTA